MNAFTLLIDLVCLASCKQLLPHQQMLDFLINLQQYLLFDAYAKHKNVKMSNHLFECFACLLNKSDSQKIIKPYLKHQAFASILRVIEEDENGDELQVSNCLYFVIWILKSLSIRCFRDCQALIEFLSQCLLSKNVKIAKIASFGFDVVMKDAV